MADYYPPIAQAVKGLEKNTAKTRRAIYDLARKAMLARLRSVTPAFSELAINLEMLALEEAIRKAETETLQRSRSRRRRSSRPPEAPRRPIGDHDKQAKMSDVGGITPEVSSRRHYLTRPSSMVQPEHIPPPAPVASRSLMTEKSSTAASCPPRQGGKNAALMVTAFMALGIGTAGGLKGIIASFQSPPDLNGTTETAARGERRAVPKIADRIGSAPVASSGTNDTALVAEKVMLYEEDRANAAGKRFGGTAVWRADSISPSAGQAPEVAIRADIEIPEERIGVRWTLRSNDDKALSASHTVEIMFTLPPDFSHGGISNVPGVLMKQAGSTPGVPLAGLGVKVATNLFLINLSSTDADIQHNVQMLKERPWLDIFVVYDDGCRAIIAIEKGISGEHVFSDAFAAWEQ